jgi:hypothetical protein
MGSMPSVPSFASVPAISVPALAGLSRVPLRFLLRASASARASSAAPVSDVWAVLAHPGRWSEFDPFLRAVEPAKQDRDDGAGDGFDVMAGQQLLAQVRLSHRQVPVEVDHVVNRSSLATTATLFHGVAEEVEHVLIPQASGGTLVTARITLHGPLALPALLPRWVFRAMTVRLLARAAEGGLRQRTVEVTSVA